MTPPKVSARFSFIVFALLATGVAGCDQATKWQALAHLTTTFDAADANGTALSFGDKLERFATVRHPRATAPIAVVDDFWRFRYVENPGASFSLLRNAPQVWRRPVLMIAGLFGLVLIVVLYRRSTPQQRWMRAALALIFGGAIGNLVDRARLGYVIDFIEWHWYDTASWPIFNVADCAVSIGVALLLVVGWTDRKTAGSSADQPPNPS